MRTKRYLLSDPCLDVSTDYKKEGSAEANRTAGIGVLMLTGLKQLSGLRKVSSCVCVQKKLQNGAEFMMVRDAICKGYQ